MPWWGWVVAVLLLMPTAMLCLWVLAIWAFSEQLDPRVKEPQGD